jgi:hypothetical protein
MSHIEFLIFTAIYKCAHVAEILRGDLFVALLIILEFYNCRAFTATYRRTGYILIF